MFVEGIKYKRIANDTIILLIRYNIIRKTNDSLSETSSKQKYQFNYIYITGSYDDTISTPKQQSDNDTKLLS